MKKVLVTGGNGQLGNCIRIAAESYPGLQFRYVDMDEMNITQKGEVLSIFQEYQPDYCVNAAAYTNVEKAESESDLAHEVNATGAGHVAQACAELGTILLHISTDYVFNGESKVPYLEGDNTDPISEYGRSKLEGEHAVVSSGCNYFIFRTSWLYSQFGHNFYKTVLRITGEGKQMTVTTEQTGVPTNANDLADAILKTISSGSEEYGLYHFSNDGVATWYDFAEAILEEHGTNKDGVLAKTNHYRTFAARPAFSVLNTTKITEKLGIDIKHWRTSLNELIKENNSTN